jgi:hypothetical protein
MKTNNVIEQINYAYIVEVPDILLFTAHTDQGVSITLTVIIEMSLDIQATRCFTPCIVETMPTSDSSNPPLSNKFEVLSQLEEESNS